MPYTQSGFAVQGAHGAHGNYELVSPSALGGLRHCWRNNDLPGAPWLLGDAFGSAGVDTVSLVARSDQVPSVHNGNLELVARVGPRLAHYTRRVPGPGKPFVWFGPVHFASGVAGHPALIQSRFGTHGNLELVVPTASGGISHYWCDNDQPHPHWIHTGVFAAGLGQVDAVAMIQSNYGGPPGNLEVIARAGDVLSHMFRDVGPAFAWSPPQTVLTSAAGIPAFIQSRHGTKGNFELVTPLAASGLSHITRDNDHPTTPWSPPVEFGSGTVSAVALIHARPGTPGAGSLDAIARVGSNTVVYVRSQAPPHDWTGPAAAACTEPLCNPVSQGEWRVPHSAGVVGIHTVLLRTGSVLFASYKEHEDQASGDSAVFNPVTGEETRLALARNVFCCGHSTLDDGRVLVVGGNLGGANALHTFTPNGGGGQWQELGNISAGRWYPTVTTLPDGRIFIIGGTGGGPRVNPHSCQITGGAIQATYEIFNPASGLEPPQPAPFMNEVDPYWLYPFVYVLPSGKLLIHAKTTTAFLDLSSFTFDATRLSTLSQTARTYPSEGTSVLLPLLPTSNPPYRARVMLIGGAGVSCPTPATDTTPATATCEVLDLGQAPLAWAPAPPMSHPRVMPDSVLLPDGTVLVMNGSSTGVADNGINPVFAVERYDPSTDTWTALCPMRVPRLYHATALLLPNGRVLTSGKDVEFNPHPFHYPEYRVEIYSPPYLFHGPRPNVTSAPDTVAYGANFDVIAPDAGAVVSAALIRPGAVTHSFNQEQRYVGLSIVTAQSGSLTLTAPPNAFVAPPGYYMLFLVNGNGVPSIGRFVKLG